MRVDAREEIHTHTPTYTYTHVQKQWMEEYQNPLLWFWCLKGAHFLILSSVSGVASVMVFHGQNDLAIYLLVVLDFK